MSNKINIVFLGTPDFACQFLEKLNQNSDFQVLAVITQEDKPFGRKKELKSPPIKELAQKLQIPVYQPEKLNKDIKLINWLKSQNPDFLVVIAYGQILSQEVLDIPKISAINVHGSILPKYRGASPIEQSLLNGDLKTGLSIMEMVKKMDAGDIYQILEQEIDPEDNNITLRQKLSKLGSEKLPNILMNIAQNKIPKKAQIESEATYCQKIEKLDGFINPSLETASQIFNKYRAYYSWPGIFIKVKEKNLKLLNIKKSGKSILSVKFQIDKNQLFLGCKEGALEILELQLEGKNKQKTENFLSGNKNLFI